MRVELKYGNGKRSLVIPPKASVSVLSPPNLPICKSIGKALNHELDYPLDCKSFGEMLRRIAPERVAIAVPDESRPAPLKQLLPIVLERIHATLPGLDSSAITIILGGGLHQPLDIEGRERIIPPEISAGCRVVSHDAIGAPMVDLGVTSRGAPVRINAEFAEAELKIVIGQIDPHQFVGFTGGAKGAVIGCGAAESIERNHSLMFDEKARPGVIEGNPVREDIDEAGDMVGIDMVVDVVLDADNNVVELLAGKSTSVLREGAKTCAALHGMAVRDAFDIVVASCGGYPKDICLYQAQKGLNLASQAAKQGGKILLLAAAPQGVGDDTYFSYVTRFATPQEVLVDFRKLGFKMGAHKAFLFARTLANHDVAVCSEMDAETLAKCHLRAADPESTIEQWVAEFDGVPRVAVVPNANTTYFYPA